ncbi:MAG: DNA polymerase III subunit gamma/tau [Anaerolineae bacterium]|nr:DNA polymerase III subunit gamma/tau [Anaerolineae bacterium]
MANQALYLKWRPQAFDEMIGQEHIVQTLRNALRQERIRHAYLFSGPRGTGKTSSARLLAKAVNCLEPNPNRRPCNACHTCQMVNEGRFLDLIEIDAASHTGVDDVRDLREKIAFAPTEGRYKVYIIDEVHRFSAAAFDALLKTLEEPPAHAIFVLATTEIDKVPATIKSRCLLFEFRRVSLRQVMERLQMICDDESISIEPAALELIARQGTGSVRDSISLLDQVIADPEQHISLELAQRMLGAVGSQAVIHLAQAIFERDAPLGLDILNEALDMGADPRQFAQQVVEHLRNVLLVQIGGRAVVDASDEMRDILADQAVLAERALLMRAVRAFNGAVAELRGGWQPQLPLELALLESVDTPVVAPVQDPARFGVPKHLARSRKNAVPAPLPLPAVAPPQGAPGVAADLPVLAQWDEVVNYIKSALRSASISGLIDHAQPQRFQQGVLYLSAENDFFRTRLEKAREDLLAALLAVFGQPVQVKIEIGSVGQRPNRPGG